MHFQSPGFRRKLDSALGIVQTALREARKPYIAFSCGKDATAVTGLVHALAPDVPLHYSDDELELPETADYATAIKMLAGEQMVITLGWARHAGWFDPWTDKPYWREPPEGALRIGMDSDRWAASRGHDLVFTGLRMGESCKRARWLRTNGPLYSVRSGCGRRCCPLWDWNEDDVWALIHGFGLAYNLAYDRMEEVGIARERQRVAPMPLSPRWHLEQGWPHILEQLEERYGKRWTDR